MSSGRPGRILALVLGLLASPLTSDALSPATVPRIGYLIASPLADPPSAERQAFLEGLRDLGWIVGRNIMIEYRSAAWNRELLPELAAELVERKVDVIVAVPGAVEAARDATKTIPIVVPAAGDPVEMGLVASLARPGGNITGTAWSTVALETKRLQLLKEAIPKASRMALLWNPTNQPGALLHKEMQAAARALGVTLEFLEVRDPKDFPNVFSAMTRKRPDAILTAASPLTSAYRPIIIEFATKNRIPTTFGLPEDVHAGGLMSYAPSAHQQFRRAAGYVDRILKGARPGDLPLELPTKFDLVINLKTAKTLGVTIPSSLRLRADHLIE